MLITVQAKSIQPPALGDDYIESKLRLMLGRFDNLIKQANVRLQSFDTSASRLSKTKSHCQCVITVKLDSHNLFEIQDDGQDIVSALDNCTHRVKRTIERHLKLANQF